MKHNIDKMPVKRILADIPIPLHHEIKARAAKMGLTVRKYMMRAILEQMRRDDELECSD